MAATSSCTFRRSTGRAGRRRRRFPVRPAPSGRRWPSAGHSSSILRSTPPGRAPTATSSCGIRRSTGRTGRRRRRFPVRVASGRRWPGSSTPRRVANCSTPPGRAATAISGCGIRRSTGRTGRRRRRFPVRVASGRRWPRSTACSTRSGRAATAISGCGIRRSTGRTGRRRRRFPVRRRRFPARPRPRPRVSGAIPTTLWIATVVH